MLRTRRVRLTVSLICISMIGLSLLFTRVNAFGATAVYNGALPMIFKSLPVDAAPVSPDANATPTPVPGDEKVLMLGAADFVIKGPTITGTGSAFPTNGGVHLPQGAEVTRMTVYYSGTTTLKSSAHVELQRQQMHTFQTLATITIPADPNAPADQVRQITIPDGRATIENRIYVYRIVMYGDDDSDINNHTPFAAYQIRLDYH